MIARIIHKTKKFIRFLHVIFGAMLMRLLISFMMISFLGSSQLSLKTKGVYFGLERGQISYFQIGGEIKWKRIKLKNPPTRAVNGGFGYNFANNSLAFDSGFWMKNARLGLTFGGDFTIRTNFNYSGWTAAPVLGFKFLMLHLQAGYYIPTRSIEDVNTNQLFIRLRYTHTNDRKLKRKKH